MTSYTSGDAKWYFADVPVTAGDTYTFSDYYISNISSTLDARFTMSNGSYTYKDLAYLDANSGTNFKKVSVDFVVPQGVVSVTFFHLISSVGFLTTDEYSLTKITVTPPDQTNLITNPNFEQTGSAGVPLSWNKGGWGTNTRTFTYPSTSYDGSKAVKVQISSYTNGDAKWYFSPISIPAGTYTYSDNYSSNISSYITAQFQKTDGTYIYKDLATLPSSNSFVGTSVDVTVPTGTQNVTIFHLIKGTGFLSLDNVFLKSKTSESNNIFSTGAVTFRFDDGWLSQYQNAIPKLNSAGFKGTFYISSKQLYENGFEGFMNYTQLADVYKKGNEIGSHTQTHAHLTNLTTKEQKTEIQGSRDDLISMGLGQVNSFSYPFGEYDANTLQIVKDAGYLDGVSTIDGYVSPSSDKYQLERQSILNTTTIKQIKAMIDNATNNKRWLILTFHDISDGSTMYSTTKEIFNQTVDYISLKKLPVITVEQGIKSL
jgi:peptidoglycan/xylan/chitin deacetylase (PgdA/CDA1 family)